MSHARRLTDPADDSPARTSPTPNCLAGVGVIVQDAQDRVLLGLGHNGRWELPGGKVDTGESFEAAAGRELAEESGLLVPPERFRVVGVVLDSGYGLNRISAAVLARPVDGTPRVTEPDKIVRWEWFAPEGIPGALFVPSAAVLRTWRPGLALPETGAYRYPAAGAQATPEAGAGQPAEGSS
ncbi:NUDIX hydrolase [Streptomyces sp. NPDC091272]|uniref:nucleotide triphosphate diphosphatase NUDT15 n=1 Tax=Streptomyces sp. NPDC091272 TaxID=3365981 RepID=UPI0038185E7D